MILPDSIYVGLGALIGALISTILSRRHAITGYRQEWINNVRDNFSLFLTKSDAYAAIVLKNRSEMNAQGIKSNTIEERTNVLHQIHSIKLFLNRAEPAHQTLFSELCNVVHLLDDIEKYEDYEKLRYEVTEQMQDILKEEWDRVRDGEWLWKLKKYLNKKA